jgi:phage-related baseplate assembly protein
MTILLEQLRTVPTRSQTLQWYLDQLQSLGFNVNGWQSGTPQRTLLLGLSRVTTNFAEIAKQIVELSFNDLARGAALEAYSIARFGNAPKPGSRAKHTVTLTNGGAVPYTIQVGQLLLATKQNVQFRNVTGGTVAAGGTLAITVEALKKGSAGNVAENALTVMVTPLAGVSAANLPGSLVSSGEDPELDTALRLRNSTQWARLTVELVADSYINIALSASENIRRAAVNDTNPRGAGTIDVYIAGAGGTVGPTETAAAQNYFRDRAFQTEGYPADPTPAPPMGANPDPTRVLVIPSGGTPVDVAGTIYYGSTFKQTDVQTKVEAAIQAFIALTPIGGYPYPAPGKVLPKENLVNAILKVPGVRTVVLTTPAADVPLVGFDVATIGNLTGLAYQPTA